MFGIFFYVLNASLWEWTKCIFAFVQNHAGTFFYFTFSTRPCFIQYMEWIGHEEWSAVHFFFISTYAHHSMYDLYLTYHASSKPSTELWINICFLSLTLQACNIWLSQKAGKLSCLSLHLPYEKKANFWSLLYGWRSRDLAEGKRGNTVEARIAKKEQKYLCYIMKPYFRYGQVTFNL